MRDHIDHQALRERLGVHLYRQRMNIQTFHAAQVIGQGRTLFHPENLLFLRAALTLGLKCCGLYWFARAHARSIRIRENRVVLRRLPESFEGFRVLQLSDLHLDVDPGITEALIGRLREVEFDLCVLTGDYRMETFGPYAAAIREIGRVAPYLKPARPRIAGGPHVLGILGNHDFLEMAPSLEEMGIRMLLNEHVRLDHEGESIYIAGVDDPHFYETDSFEKALNGIPAEATKILLSHTAEPVHPALGCGVDLMLSGHTHGGQICLPGGVPILHNANHPRFMDKGPWRFHELRGFTSVGVGCSAVPIRAFCPPEIVVHTLERDENED